MFEKLSKKLSELLYNAGIETSAGDFIIKLAVLALGFGFGVGLLVYRALPVELTALLGISTVIIFVLSVYVMLILTANKRVAMMEDMLPDFLTLMASNIRSGLTPDRALFVSARKEFGPLTREINRAAKLSMTGSSFDEAFESIAENAQSETISKVVRLIVEGIKSGGDLADLLDNTADDIRKFSSIRKEVSANITIYSLFLFAAAGFGAPLLYATATFLISIISTIKTKLAVEAGIGAAEAAGLPILKGAALSPDLTFWFSIAALTVTTFFAALASGVISAGRESEGMRYVPVLLIASLGIFLATMALLDGIFSTLFIT
jgi:pilus assembly protein TadC